MTCRNLIKKHFRYCPDLIISCDTFWVSVRFFFFLVQEVFDNMWQPAVSKCWHSVPPIHVLPLEVLKHADRAHKYSGYLNVERPFPVFVSYGVSLRSRCCLPGWQVFSVSSCVVVLEQGVVCVFVLPCLVIRWVFFFILGCLRDEFCLRLLRCLKDCNRTSFGCLGDGCCLFLYMRGCLRDRCCLCLHTLIVFLRGRCCQKTPGCLFCSSLGKQMGLCSCETTHSFDPRNANLSPKKCWWGQRLQE